MPKFEWKFTELTEDERKDIFCNDGLPWKQEDDEYLLEWYEKIGPREMSYALGRSPNACQIRQFTLKRKMENENS